MGPEPSREMVRDARGWILGESGSCIQGALPPDSPRASGWCAGAGFRETRGDPQRQSLLLRPCCAARRAPALHAAVATRRRGSGRGAGEQPRMTWRLKRFAVLRRSHLRGGMYNAAILLGGAGRRGRAPLPGVRLRPWRGSGQCSRCERTCTSGLHCLRRGCSFVHGVSPLLLLALSSLFASAAARAASGIRVVCTCALPPMPLGHFARVRR